MIDRIRERLAALLRIGADAEDFEDVFTEAKAAGLDVRGLRAELSRTRKEMGMSEDTEATHELDSETLRGDIRDELLREFKHMPRSWQQMNENEQQRQIHRAADIANTLVRRAVDLVAARDLPALPIEVGKFTVDGAAIKGSFECYADDESLLRIKHLANKRAMFVLASPDAYNGEKGTPETEVVGDLAIPKEALVDQAEENLAKVGRGKKAAA